MTQYDLKEIKSLIKRLAVMADIAEHDSDSWERSVAMGEIRLMAGNLFGKSYEQIRDDDPHNWGELNLVNYLTEAYKKWDEETREGRTKAAAETARQHEENLRWLAEHEKKKNRDPS